MALALAKHLAVVLALAKHLALAVAKHLALTLEVAVGPVHSACQPDSGHPLA